MLYISQVDEYDCGYAALKTMLANLLHDKNALYLNFRNVYVDGRMASFYELVKIAKEYGVTLIPFKEADHLSLNKKDYPMLLDIKSETESHLVYVYKVTSKYVYFVNPACGKVKQKLGDFQTNWNRSGLLIKNIITSSHKISEKFKFISMTQYISLFLFQLASSLCCILGFNFLDTKYPIYMPIMMCSLFVIMELALRKYALIILTKFDKKIINFEGNVEQKDYEKFLHSVTNLKKTILTNKMEIFSSIFVIGIGTFLMVMSSTFNLIYLGIGFILAIINVFINKHLHKQEYDLSKKEKQLIRSNNFNEFKSNLDTINSSTYLYANKVMSAKYVSIALCVISSITMMFILKINNPAYIVLMTMITYVFFQQFLTIFSYKDKAFLSDKYYMEVITLLQKHS